MLMQPFSCKLIYHLSNDDNWGVDLFSTCTVAEILSFSITVISYQSTWSSRSLSAGVGYTFKKLLMPEKTKQPLWGHQTGSLRLLLCVCVWGGGLTLHRQCDWLAGLVLSVLVIDGLDVVAASVGGHGREDDQRIVQRDGAVKKRQTDITNQNSAKVRRLFTISKNLELTFTPSFFTLNSGRAAWQVRKPLRTFRRQLTVLTLRASPLKNTSGSKAGKILYFFSFLFTKFFIPIGKQNATEG